MKRAVALLLLLAACTRSDPSEWVEKRAGQTPYLERCTEAPSAIVLYLHAWTSTYREPTGWPQLAGIKDACIVSPEFNSADGTPACGSDDAMASVKRVIDTAMSEHRLSRVVLLGYSGGGYMSLMTLGRFPDLAEGASVWLPIYDLATWYEERPGHRAELEHCFGGPPSPEYRRRSPAEALAAAHARSVTVNGGAHDEEVPNHHAKEAAQALAAPYIEHDTGHTFLPEVAVEQVNEMLLTRVSRTR